MRAALMLLFLGASLLSGCTVYDKIAHNLVVDPAHFNRFSDKLGRGLRDKCLANEAWDEICVRDGDVYSRHYYRGFIAGFTDYLDSGGTGEPPPLPPRSYWRLYYQTPEGHQATQDWFAGFRHGADVARASGVRDLVTVPVSSVPPKETRQEEEPAPSEKGNTESPKKPDQSPTAPLPKPPDTKEGPMPPKTVNGKPMPTPTPPIIPVERMIAPPVPKSNVPR